MRIRSEFLSRFHLDKRYCLLNARSVQLLKGFFDALDFRAVEYLDDIQFLAFMKHITDLRESQIHDVFDMFDVDGSGTIQFDEFYLLVCILIAVKDRQTKSFLSQQSATCFALLDEDGSKTITIPEFQRFGFVFNFGRRAVNSIFKDFDIDDSKELDFEEFKMFTIACMDKQQELEARMATQQERRRHKWMGRWSR